MSKMRHKNRSQRKQPSIAAAMTVLLMACVIALQLAPKRAEKTPP